MYVRPLLVSLAFLGVMSTSGCAIANRLAVQQDRHTTIGQELIDLKKAKDAGVLSDSEYETARTKIMTWTDTHNMITEACCEDKKTKP
jgi:hypothetical protein